MRVPLSGTVPLRRPTAGRTLLEANLSARLGMPAGTMVDAAADPAALQERPMTDHASGNATDPDTRGRARALYDALRTHEPIEPLTTGAPDFSLEQAYEVQRRLVEMLLADGDQIVGYKLGLTSRPMQELLGVDTPDFSAVVDSQQLPDGAVVALDRFISPMIEAEFVFHLASPLQGPGVTIDEVVNATESISAGLEIVDSRIRDWAIRLPDTVADLASCGAVVVSARREPLPVGGARLLGMALSRNGELVDTGCGAATLGDPAAAVAWLANTLGSRGVRLEPGQLILTGALHKAVPLARGDHFVAEFDRIGSVDVHVE
ncbi:2-keto-4-pentenoate hydratase [Egicoccus sp. AB-alg6-2]|uniref:2-keto-4-pentenoate hydratase n=1 Tax=Egicoccus sp. AB-alg6-2 TaxID=3242692 RepID=UPI00359D84AE